MANLIVDCGKLPSGIKVFVLRQFTGGNVQEDSREFLIKNHQLKSLRYFGYSCCKLGYLAV